jgi:formylglycine-generating enzyme required for sulfatase activity
VQFMATNPWPEAPDREVISDLTFRAGSRKAVERAFKEMEKKVHEVQARKSYRWPKGASQEIVGKDGAPMVLVPEGEFVYDLGFGAKIVALPAFYIDKFEVTTKRYAAFRQAAGRAEPEFWNQVIFDRDGDRPVIGISWHDADAYCRYYGKWLPTEEEWEKAARGTDGRVYPWGYEQPTIRHANFNKPVDWERKGYATLSPVGSYEEGKSPYGAYDMAGNVWEWTSSDDLKDRAEPRKWIRGGGWNNTSALPLETTWRLSEVPEFGGKTVGFRCAQGVR